MRKSHKHDHWHDNDAGRIIHSHEHEHKVVMAGNGLAGTHLPGVAIGHDSAPSARGAARDHMGDGHSHEEDK